MSNLQIVPATEPDIPVILDLIHALAEYEKLAHVVTASPERLRETLFGIKPAAEVLLAHWARECEGFAAFFATYSTLLAQQDSIWKTCTRSLTFAGKGIHLARIATERELRQCVASARLERASHPVLQEAGRRADG